MNTVIKMDNVDLGRFLLAFVFVLGLIGLMSALLKRYASSHKWIGAAQDGDRLHIVQTRYIDAKRKLVLVRHDDHEHLLLLADGRETVIESAIPLSVSEKPHA